MGLLHAAVNSLTGELSEQYKEFFYCESLPADTLAVKGRKRRDRRAANRGSDNVITTGSVIAVADGQCMMIVEQGRVVELCAESGHFVYDASTEPSFFAGGLGQGFRAFLDKLGERVSFGGQKPKDQRVYYFNTKEISGNKYGTASAVPFRVVDQRAGIDLDISVRCFGEYSYRIANPMLFYTNVCGNVADAYTRDQLDGQLKSEFLTALQPAFARISEMGIRYSALPGHTAELAQAMNDALCAKWRDLRGLEVVSVGVSSVKASEEDEAIIREMQRAAAFQNSTLAAANLAQAQAGAMRDAARNAGGAAVGFMGLNMAAQSGGVNAAQLYQMGQQQMNQQMNQQPPAGDAWTCPRCGTANTGKFCMECGTKRPSAGVSACPKCGWTVPNPASPPKFCPECGNAFSLS